MLLFIHIRLNIAILKSIKNYLDTILSILCVMVIFTDKSSNDNDDYCTFTDLVDGKISFDDFDTFCIIDKVPDENELYKIVEFVCSNGKISYA